MKNKILQLNILKLNIVILQTLLIFGFLFNFCGSVVAEDIISEENILEEIIEEDHSLKTKYQHYDLRINKNYRFKTPCVPKKSNYTLFASKIPKAFIEILSKTEAVRAFVKGSRLEFLSNDGEVMASLPIIANNKNLKEDFNKFFKNFSFVKNNRAINLAFKKLATDSYWFIGAAAKQKYKVLPIADLLFKKGKRRSVVSAFTVSVQRKAKKLKKDTNVSLLCPTLSNNAPREYQNLANRIAKYFRLIYKSPLNARGLEKLNTRFNKVTDGFDKIKKFPEQEEQNSKLSLKFLELADRLFNITNKESKLASFRSKDQEKENLITEVESLNANIANTADQAMQSNASKKKERCGGTTYGECPNSTGRKMVCQYDQQLKSYGCVYENACKDCQANEICIELRGGTVKCLPNCEKLNCEKDKMQCVANSDPSKGYSCQDTCESLKCEDQCKECKQDAFGRSSCTESKCTPGQNCLNANCVDTCASLDCEKDNKKCNANAANPEAGAFCEPICRYTKCGTECCDNNSIGCSTQNKCVYNSNLNCNQLFCEQNQQVCVEDGTVDGKPVYTCKDDGGQRWCLQNCGPDCKDCKKGTDNKWFCAESKCKEHHEYCHYVKEPTLKPGVCKRKCDELKCEDKEQTCIEETGENPYCKKTCSNLKCESWEVCKEGEGDKNAECVPNNDCWNCWEKCEDCEGNSTSGYTCGESYCTNSQICVDGDRNTPPNGKAGSCRVKTCDDITCKSNQNCKEDSINGATCVMKTCDDITCEYYEECKEDTINGPSCIVDACWEHWKQCNKCHTDTKIAGPSNCEESQKCEEQDGYKVGLCVDKCLGSEQWDSATKKCVCLDGYVRANDTICYECNQDNYPNREWKDGKCVCITGYTQNSSGVCEEESEPEPSTPIVQGCMDKAASNYNSEATEDDGSCVYEPEPSTPPVVST